jgi:hypothetical protein
VAIRTVDPADQDFSDLEPLRAAIGTARIVQLGEPSHGAGSSFAAKTRLVMFLHQRGQRRGRRGAVGGAEDLVGQHGGPATARPCPGQPGQPQAA